MTKYIERSSLIQPNNLSVVDESTGIALKNKGNEYFVAKKFVDAIECYTKGLEIVNVNGYTGEVIFLDMLANRAAAYINLGCFQKGLSDAESVLKINPCHSKGIYRKVKCLFGLGRCTDASNFLEKCNDRNIFADLAKESKILLNQQIHGEYDIQRLYEQGASRAGCLDVADFVGSIKIEKIPGRGRGVIATEDIRPGQLVMAAKAFAIVFPSHNVNFDTKLIHETLIQKIGGKIALERSFGQNVYDLYAGNEFGKNPTEFSGADEVADMRRIEAICRLNAFSGEKQILDGCRESRSCGLWILPAYINHSCWDSNCTWMIIGDVMFVRAFKNIMAGSEVLISYFSPSLLYKSRRERLENYGFVCECSLCLIDRCASVESLERLELLDKIENYFKNEDNVECVLDYIETLENLNLFKLNRNPSLVFPLMHMAEYFGEKKQHYEKSVQLLTKCHEITANSPMMRTAVKASINILGILIMLENKEEAVKWVEILKRDLLITYGTLDMVNVFAKNTLVMLEKAGISFY